MGEIHGREQETQLLEKLLHSNEAELVAVYGRRRTGKTFIINSFFRDKVVYFEWVGVASGTAREQLHNFVRAFRRGFGVTDEVKRPTNWQEAFDLLADQVALCPPSQKIVLFFDELPWLAGQSSQMLRALEHLWNSTLSKMSNVIMILCGSAASWMIKKIVNNRKGFYGRMTQCIHLLPFTLSETEMYLKAKGVVLDRKQIAEIYMVTGGVAKYLNHVSPGLSSAQVIQELCFSKTGFLSQEFYGLFESLFDNHSRHVAIVKALATVHYGMTNTEISEKAKIPSGGTLKVILEELEVSGFISKVRFYGQKKREARYRLVDEYTLFYLRWMEKSSGGSITPNYWSTMHSSASYRSWCGYAFENLCMKHVESITEALKISVVAEEISYWNSQAKHDEEGAQIDLIIQRRDKCINLCEIKFCSDEYVVSQKYGEGMNARREIFRRATKYKGAIFNTLITPYGAKKTPPYLLAVDQQLDMGIFFKKR